MSRRSRGAGLRREYAVLMPPLLGAERRELLMSILGRAGVIRLDTAAEELGVSVMTVRRDLGDLEAEGLVRRVRGGAVAPILPEPFGARAASRSTAKGEIARKALALVPAQGAVAFDASTTSGALLTALDARDLLVCTNSVENAAAARRRPGVRSVLVGGELEETTGSFVGPIAHLAARSLSYAVFFTSASAVDAEFGPSEASLAEVEVKRCFADQADRTVLLVDASKLGLRALARGLDWAAIDLLITELSPSDARLDPYRDLVEVL